jgi:predicted nucleotidyltransferase
MNPVAIDRAIQKIASAVPPRAVRALVLFGSAARGEASEASDIDLLVLPSSPRSAPSVDRALRAIEREHRVKISVLTSRSPNLVDLDRQLLDSILRHGKILVGSLPTLGPKELDLEAVRLLSLDLRGMDQRAKVRLERELFGYTSRRAYRTKTYVSRTPGRIERLGGRRVGRSLVILPERAMSSVDAVLRAYGAHRVFVPAWVQRP